MNYWSKLANPSYDEACRIAAEWVVILVRLGIRVIFVVIGSEDCEGFTFFVEVEPDTRHCEFLRCFRKAHQEGDCTGCEASDELMPEQYKAIHIRTHIVAEKLIHDWLDESQSQVKVIANRLALGRHLDGAVLLRGVKLPVPYDFERFWKDAVAVFQALY